MGQGLLETTAAIGIILTGLFAVFTLAIANGRAADAASERFVAVQLAREGIDVVRIIRDSNWLAGRAWNAGLDGDGTSIPVFTPVNASWALADGPNDFAAAATRIVRVSGGSGTFLVHDSAGGEGDAVTPYRRLLAFASICADRGVRAFGSCDPERNPAIGMRATSRVSWVIRGAAHDLAFEEDLYDWR